MSAQGLLPTLATLLGAGVISVPIAKRLGLGSVLGYLFAGALIGPFALGLVSDSGDILHVAEFGVVMLLFLVGLELEPKRLWALRMSIFGLGSVQMILCAAAIAACLIPFQWNASAAIVAGLGFAMSSTAIVLQILSERGLSKTQVGQDSFSVLLFQDLAIIPILAILPALGSGTQTANSTSGLQFTPIERTLLAFLIIGGLIGASRTVIRPVFHWIAKTRQKELFTATSLLIVIGVALIMERIGLSMALGTFLAGVVLAESEYRHELESNIEPFKGILLGIFFTAVGSSMQFPLLQERTQAILTLVLILLTAKITFTKLSTKIFKSNPASGWTTSVLLSQGGEFGFVLFGAAVSAGVLTRTQSDELTLAVALSMFTTPLLLKATEKLTKTKEAVSDHQNEEKIENLGEEIIIAGMGRYGQIVARLLLAQKIIPKIIDLSPESLERLRVFGFKVFYGDATEITLLESAGIEQAKVLVIAIDNRESILKVAKAVHSKYPHIKILARAFDLMHVYELMDVGVNDAERETFNAALATGEQTLTAVGFHPFAARRAAKMFREYDIKLFNQLHSVAKQRSEFTSSAVAAREEIVRIFNADRNYIEEGGADTAWSKLDKV